MIASHLRSVWIFCLTRSNSWRNSSFDSLALLPFRKPRMTLFCRMVSIFQLVTWLLSSSYWDILMGVFSLRLFCTLLLNWRITLSSSST